MSRSEFDLKWTFDAETGEEQGPGDALGQNFKHRPYASLLREAVQNSLDVPANPNTPVIVTFSFGKMREKDFPNFFDIRKHLEGCAEYWHGKPDIVKLYNEMLSCFSSDFNTELSYLKVSDRNTVGMNYRPNDNTTPFYAFVRAAKVSNKPGEGSGGSYGYGKAAYLQLSPIKALIISTMTSEGKLFFEGKSVLCTHLFNGEKKTSVGYYDNNNGQAPVSDVEKIPQRFVRTEPGTDFYIMGFAQQEKEEAIRDMIEEAVRSFFAAIHRQKLVIEFKIDKEHTLVLNHESLPIVMNDFFTEEKDNSAQLRALNPRPYYEAITKEEDGRQFIHFTDTIEPIGRVHLFVKREKGASDKILYMRSPLMSIYANRPSSSLGFYGVFICDDLRGNKLLQKLENSSHTQWETSNWRDTITQKAMPLGKSAKEAVKKFCEDCMQKLKGDDDSTELDISGLEDMLYVPDALIDDESYGPDTPIGSPTGEFVDIGSSMTTVSVNDEIPQRDKNESTSKGTIMGAVGGGIVITETGPDIAGVSQEGKRRGGKEGTSKPGADKAPVERVEGDESHYGILEVGIRSFAQVENGMTYHYITIHSDQTVNNGIMEIVVCGEIGDVKVNIVESSIGSATGNRISGIYIPAGTSRLRIRFADNMKYTLKTTVYYEE
jgi:hypothetical protein